MEHILKLEQVKKYYGGAAGNITKAVDGISMEVNKGEFTAIMGASGSGKTTLLNCISTIDRVTAGHIYVGDKDITTIRGNELNKFRREELGFIFQDFNLLDSLSVKENIMLPVLLDKIEQKECEEKAESLEKQFGIDQLEDKSPYELSGGERQRVAICRALINNPSIIFADEPTGNLDSKSGKVVADEFQKINETLGKTILMVTHDPQMASRCKRVIFLKDGLVMNDVRKSGSDEEFYKVIIGEIEKF